MPRNLKNWEWTIKASLGVKSPRRRRNTHHTWALFRNGCDSSTPNLEGTNHTCPVPLPLSLLPQSQLSCLNSKYYGRIQASEAIWACSWIGTRSCNQFSHKNASTHCTLGCCMSRKTIYGAHITFNCPKQPMTICCVDRWVLQLKPLDGISEESNVHFTFLAQLNTH